MNGRKQLAGLEGPIKPQGTYFSVYITVISICTKQCNSKAPPYMISVIYF